MTGTTAPAHGSRKVRPSIAHRVAHAKKEAKAPVRRITAQTFDRAISQAVRLGLADAVRGEPPRRTWRQLEELGLPANLSTEIVDALRAAYMGARTVAPKVI